VVVAVVGVEIRVVGAEEAVVVSMNEDVEVSVGGVEVEIDVSGMAS